MITSVPAVTPVPVGERPWVAWSAGSELAERRRGAGAPHPHCALPRTARGQQPADLLTLDDRVGGSAASGPEASGGSAVGT
jgi:hypothetical protein